MVSEGFQSSNFESLGKMKMKIMIKILPFGGSGPFNDRIKVLWLGNKVKGEIYTEANLHLLVLLHRNLQGNFFRFARVLLEDQFNMPVPECVCIPPRAALRLKLQMTLHPYFFLPPPSFTPLHPPHPLSLHR